MCAYPMSYSANLTLTEPGMSSFRLSPAMSNYSILFEADEYREVGPFRFPIYHDFTPGESRAYEKLQKSFASGTYTSMQLASRIAEENNIEPEAALQILGSISANENQKYLFKYAEDVQKLTDGMLSQDEQNALAVTFFMQMRGEVRDPESGEWVRTDQWSEEDTDQVPGKLIREIHQLLLWERNGWPAVGNEESAPAPSKRVIRAQKASTV